MSLNGIIEIGSVKTTLTELIAVSFGLASVWSMKKENILAFPFGIVNVLIYAWICFNSKLYAYSGINVFYAVMSVYGWINWSRKDRHADKIRIAASSVKATVANLAAVLVFFIVLRILLIKYTDSIVPSWDAITTAIYIIAMWLLARKKIENWIGWIIGDIISIFLFGYEKLYFSSFQFLVFTIIAVFGYFEWRRKLISNSN